jgi:hypothetical protein
MIITGAASIIVVMLRGRSIQYSGEPCDFFVGGPAYWFARLRGR